MLDPYAPTGFECEYKNCCPHMNRISTSWVFGQYQRLELLHGKLWVTIDELHGLLGEAEKRIAQLEREKAELEAKYRSVHQRQFKASRKRPRRRLKQLAARQLVNAAHPKGIPDGAALGPSTLTRWWTLPPRRSALIATNSISGKGRGWMSTGSKTLKS